MPRLALALASTLTMSACAGTVTTSKLSPTAERTKGVIFYAPTYAKMTYAFTAYVDDKGKLVGTAADRACKPTIQKEEVQLVADLEKPYVVNLSSGFFNANKLGVTIANGLLTGVNAESGSKIPELLTAVGTVAQGVAAFGLAPGDTSRACNAAPSLVAFRRISLDGAIQ
jgi:hypothetical protein